MYTIPMIIFFFVTMFHRSIVYYISYMTNCCKEEGAELVFDELEQMDLEHDSLKVYKCFKGID